MTQCDRLAACLRCGRWMDNFTLYRILYGSAPCGRLSARIYDLRRRGEVIKQRTDREHIGNTSSRTADRRRVWYRLEGAAS